MAVPRSIAVNEAAYRALESAKRPGESFSETIIRRIKGGSILDVVGFWSDMTDAEYQEFRKRIDEGRRLDKKRTDALLRRWKK